MATVSGLDFTAAPEIMIGDRMVEKTSHALGGAASWVVLAIDHRASMLRCRDEWTGTEASIYQGAWNMWRRFA